MAVTNPSSDSSLTLGNFWQETVAALEAHFELQPLAPPEEFARKRPLNERSDALLQFFDFKVLGIGDLRATVIEGSRAQIVNVMLFPHDPTRLPVFASEIVVFAQAVRVGVIDLQPLVSSETFSKLIYQDLAAIKEQFADLPDGGELPDWAREHFTVSCIHARASDMACLPRLHDAYLAYLEHFIVTAKQAPSVPRPSNEHESVRHYKDHHIANTPGLPFLSRLYGEDWTQRFLRQGMYA